jgi:asparagine synthetase B (glutamine-hydrolysing)
MHTTLSTPALLLPCPALFFLLLLHVACAGCCSILVASYDLRATHSAGQIAAANRQQARRGPDGTNVRSANGWTFLHNLLSMTGRPTQQPFVSDDETLAVLFNGEIYNFRAVARQLGLSLAADASDGEVLLPAYRE